MPQHNRLSAFPQRLRVGSAPHEHIYTRRDGYYAVHGRPAGTPAPGAVLTLNDHAIAVFEGTPDDADAERLTPVYATAPDAPLAVPTGEVFIRFSEDDDAAEHHDALAEAGYEIARRLDYAPHAAWLRARSGRPADALARLGALEAHTGVVHVEPQLLHAAARR